MLLHAYPTQKTAHPAKNMTPWQWWVGRTSRWRILLMYPAPLTVKSSAKSPVQKKWILKSLIARVAKDASKTSVVERANLLLKIADKMEANLEAIAIAETYENGKPVRETLADIPLGCRSLSLFCQCHSCTRRRHQSNWWWHGCLSLPWATWNVGQIIPWNFRSSWQYGS